MSLICMSDAKIFLILLVFLTFCYLGGLRGAVSTRKKKYIFKLRLEKRKVEKVCYPSWPPKKGNYALTRSFGQRWKRIAFPSFWGCQSKILGECGYRLEFSLHLLLNSSYFPNHLKSFIWWLDIYRLFADQQKAMSQKLCVDTPPCQQFYDENMKMSVLIRWRFYRFWLLQYTVVFYSGQISIQQLLTLDGIIILR